MTLKQIKATKILVENGGNDSVGGAMRKAGYSPATAKTPQKLTQSKGFQELKKQYQDELMATGIDGERLAKKMNEWLEAKKVISSMTEPDREVPDYRTQLEAFKILREDLGITGKGVVLNQFNVEEMGIEFVLSENAQ